MRILSLWKSIAAVVLTIAVVFIGTSLFDVILSVISMRFYSTAAFITIFGVGGVFATVFAYQSGIAATAQKNELARWAVIITIIFTGLLFFFLLSRLEGGEYEMPFKAFGATAALTSLLFRKGKIEL